jgi:hypothetical protein
MFGCFLRVSELGVSTLDIHAASRGEGRPGDKENVLEVQADTNKYMVMSQDQIAWRSYHTKLDNRSSEGVKQIKYIGTNIINQIYI